MSSLKKFIIHFSHYLTGNISTQLLGFITFPILTRILSIEQYGILSLISTTMLFSVAIAKAGLSDGIIRFYKEFSESQERLTLFSSTIFIRGLLFSALTVLIYIIIFSSMSKYLFISDRYIVYFMIMAVSLFLEPLKTIVLNVLRATGRTLFFNLINLLGRIISIALSLLMLIYIFHEFYGYFIGIVFSEIIVSLILFYWFFTNYKINLTKVSGSLTMKLTKFGIPLLFTEISYLLLTYVDRYLIVAYLGESSLGLYSIGYNLAMYIAVAINLSLTYAVIPIFVDIYEREGKEKTEKFLEKCLHYLLMAIIPICAGYYLVSEDLIITLASQKYATAATFSPIILIGTFFLGINNILNAGLYLKKKSMTILIIMFSAVIINIVMNLILLPKYELTGAAIATLTSCIMATILTICFSFKYILIRIDVKTLFYYSVLSTLMFFVVKQIETSEAGMNLIAKISVGIVIILLGMLYREKELLSKIKVISQLKKRNY